MSTNFGLAGIPGTRLKVCVWVGGGGGSHTQYRITPVPILGAGALMLNAWDWTVTICVEIIASRKQITTHRQTKHQMFKIVKTIKCKFFPPVICLAFFMPVVSPYLRID